MVGSVNLTGTSLIVDWVNDFLPDGPAWRLPTEADIRDPAFRLIVTSTERHGVCDLTPGDWSTGDEGP